jgi:hypothetical protein
MPYDCVAPLARRLQGLDRVILSRREFRHHARGAITQRGRATIHLRILLTDGDIEARFKSRLDGEKVLCD